MASQTRRKFLFMLRDRRTEHARRSMEALQGGRRGKLKGRYKLGRIHDNVILNVDREKILKNVSLLRNESGPPACRSSEGWTEGEY